MGSPVRPERGPPIMPGSPSASVAAARATKAALTRRRVSNDPALLAADRHLREARLAEYISKTLAAVPPLTDDQRSRLALLLRSPAAGGGTAT